MVERIIRTSGPVEPAFISSMYVACQSQKQYTILACIFVDLLVVTLGLRHEPQENKNETITFDTKSEQF